MFETGGVALVKGREESYPDFICRQYTVKHNSIGDFIKVYFLHCFFQRHVSALVMSHLQVDYFSY
jgi:hypothetical protein